MVVSIDVHGSTDSPRTELRANQKPIRRDAVQGALGRRVLKVREVKRNDAARPYERFLHAHVAHAAHATHSATTAHAAARWFVFRRFSDHGLGGEDQGRD